MSGSILGRVREEGWEEGYRQGRELGAYYREEGQAIGYVQAKAKYYPAYKKANWALFLLGLLVGLSSGIAFL